MAEEDGDEEDDQDQQDGELAVVDILGDGEREVCSIFVSTDSDSLTSRYQERHLHIVSNVANKLPDTKHRKI